MTTIQPSKAATARTAAHIRDILDLARQVAVAESDWDLFTIAAALLRGSDPPPAYQTLSLAAGLVRWIAARCGDAPGAGSAPSPEIAEKTIDEMVRGTNFSLMSRKIGHREAGLQKQVLALADPRIPLGLVPGLAEQFGDHAAGGRIDRLEAVEAGVHAVAYLASMSGDAVATLDAAECELLGPLAAELETEHEEKE
jgi:hypothetical protein